MPQISDSPVTARSARIFHIKIIIIYLSIVHHMKREAHRSHAACVEKAIQARPPAPVFGQENANGEMPTNSLRHQRQLTKTSSLVPSFFQVLSSHILIIANRALTFRCYALIRHNRKAHTEPPHAPSGQPTEPAAALQPVNQSIPLTVNPM